MAKTLATYDFKQASSLTKEGRATYPWDEWFNGEIWQLTVNEDFHSHPLMMERIIRTRATAKGAKINLRHEPLNGDVTGIIVLRRSDIPQPTPVKKAPARKTPSKAAPAAPAAKATTKAASKAAPAKAAAKPAKKGLDGKPITKATPAKPAASKKAPKRPVKK